jgi:hypothetical protein
LKRIVFYKLSLIAGFFSINGDADWQDCEAGQFDFHSRWQCHLYRL